MLKVFYIVSTLGRSGPTNQLFNIIKNLDRSNFEPILLTLSPEPSDSRWLDFQLLDIKVFSLNRSRLGGVLFYKKKIETIINNIQPSLIHTQGIRADVLVSKIDSTIPHIATIHNFPEIDYRMSYGWLLSLIMVEKHIHAMKSIDILIGCSYSVERNLKHFHRLKNTCAIRNGVDEDLFYPQLNSDYNLRISLGVGLNDKIWISTGPLSERKDPLFLLNAWSLIEEKHPDHHLVFLGSGNLAEECSSRARELKNVHMVGQVSNVLDFLQESDFFITASKSEGLPMAAIEAMACGLPLLVSDIESYKEIFALSDKVGQLYQLGSKDSFFKSFSVLIGQDYTESSQAAYTLVKEKLNAKTMSDSYQSIYNELLGR